MGEFSVSFIQLCSHWYHLGLNSLTPSLHFITSPISCMSSCQDHVLGCFSYVWLFAMLWTIAHQAPLSMGFSRNEYWNGLPFPSPGPRPYGHSNQRSGCSHQSRGLDQSKCIPTQPSTAVLRARLEKGSPKLCFRSLYSPQNLKLLSQILSTHRQLMMSTLTFWVLLKWERKYKTFHFEKR